MAFANYIKILDISIGGLLIETDKNWDIGEEYILQVEYEGKQWPLKGYIIWSTLKEWKNNDNSVPIYRVGMKLTSTLNEIHELLKFIRLRLKRGEKNEYFSLSLDETDIQGKDTRHLESLQIFKSSL